jgi:hypothetical protein
MMERRWRRKGYGGGWTGGADLALFDIGGWDFNPADRAGGWHGMGLFGGGGRHDASRERLRRIDAAGVGGLVKGKWV